MRRPSASSPRRLIQVAGTFASRQEEAQRLGRLLRPKKSGLPASFYTLVSRDTVDQIASTPVGRQDRPQTDVVISSVEVERVDS